MYRTLNKLVTIAALTLLCIACGREETGTGVDPEKVPAQRTLQLSASIEGSAFDNSVSISIFDSNKNYPLKLEGGTGSTDIYADGGSTLMGLYPYSEKAFLSDSEIATCIPDSQSACKDGVDPANDLAITQFDYAESGSVADFRRICGRIALTLGDENVVRIIFSAADSTPLAGDCLVSWDGGSPAISFINRKNSISLQSADGAMEKGASYYLSTAPAELKNGALLTLFYADGGMQRLTLEGPLSISRAGKLDLGEVRLGVPEKSSEFDENQVVASLAAISDTHIGNGYGSEAKFTKALRQLGTQASKHDLDGLDGVLIVGDVTDANNANQAWTLKNLYEEVYSPSDVPMVYTIGNHDIMNPLNSVLGAEYFSADVGTEDMRVNHECRHCVVGGVHVLGIAPNHYGATSYDATAKQWLDDTLAELTAAEPEKYVLILTHPMIYDTCYGSLLGPFWYTTELTPILKKYPQAVTFGGHLHFPVNDPRSIWQGDFTSMGCGSVSYMAIENGGYEYMKSSTVMQDAGDISSGLLLQFDASGNMRIWRMDFSNATTIGEPWEISYPLEDKSHLAKYNFEARKAVNTAPEFSGSLASSGGSGASSSGTSSSVLGVTISGTTATAKWTAASDDEFVHHYVLKLYSDGTLLKTKKILADFYRCPQPSGMKSEWTEPFASLAEGSYELVLTAIDSWDAESAPISTSFSIGTNATLWVDDNASSKAVSGGSGSVSGDWYSYSDGTLSWTANATGLPRKAFLSLPNGSSLNLTQLSADDFAGGWTLYSKTFARLGNYITPATAAKTSVKAKGPLRGESLEYGSETLNNNMEFYGIAGSASELVMNGHVNINYDAHRVRMGLFFDGRKAQKLTSGSQAGGYAAFLPELCGEAWANDYYEFGRAVIGSPNYDWMWLDVAIEDGRITATHLPLKQKIAVSHSYSQDYIIGIEVMHFSSETVSEETLTRGSQTYTHVPGQTNSADYLVIHQENYNNSTANGLFLIRE